jgi:hypothetical protein
MGVSVMSERTIELRQYMLGLQPYTLIELGSGEAEGDIKLTAEFGGGAEDAIMMPLMLVSETPASEAHPLAVMLQEIYGQSGDRGPAGDGWRAAVAAVVEQINEEWLPFVQSGEPEPQGG